MNKVVGMRAALRTYSRDQLPLLVDSISKHGRKLKVLLAFCLSIWLLGASLQLGAWKLHRTYYGPFYLASDGRQLFSVEIEEPVPFWLSIRLDLASGFGLRLESGGHEIAGPLMPSIYQGFSYWTGKRKRELTFALPDGAMHEEQLTLKADFIVRLHSTLYDFARWSAVWIFLICAVPSVYGANLRFSTGLRFVKRLGLPRVARDYGSRIVARSMLVVSGATVVGCAVYIASIIYGLFAGDALPTTALFRLVPGDILEQIESALPMGVLLFAAVGTLLAWAASWRAVPVELIRNTERRLIDMWSVCGLPVILSFFLFSMSSGGWSGHARPIDVNYMSLGGLIPHSDARAYFSDIFHQAVTGRWDVLGSRRPLAAAFREITVVAALYSYVGALLVQAAMVAVALFLAARSLVRWHGIWAGIAFVGFIYILARPFLQTTLTEPLGLIWALFSIMFFVDAIGLKSRPHALVALAGLTVGLLTRMGSLFTIPVIVLWITVALAHGLRARLRTFLAACAVVIAVLALNGTLALLYGSPSVSTGSNFAWTACGLSMGTGWGDCERIYAAQLAEMPNERVRAVFLLLTTWNNILRNPEILFFTLLRHMLEYVDGFSSFMFKGYGGYESLLGVFAEGFVAVLLISIIYINRLRGTFFEFGFWIVVLASILMSATIVMGDDGWRILLVTHALIAYLLSSGFSAPSVAISSSLTPTCQWKTGASAFAAIVALFLIFPVIANAVAVHESPTAPETIDPSEHIVAGDRHMTGFLVVPDDETVVRSVPSLHRSQFAELVRMAHWEADFGPILNGLSDRDTFAFILAARSDQGKGGIYFAPPFVLTSPDTCVWRFTVRGRGAEYPTSAIVFDVLAARKQTAVARMGDRCTIRLF
jgi:hypothetical protein